MKLQALNQASEARFLEVIGGPLEGQTWLAERVAGQRPFESVDALYEAFRQAVHNATPDEKIALIASHPDLATKAAVSPTSALEQSAAGLDQLTQEEYATFTTLNNAYKANFGFPFVICARENTKASILASFRTRLEHTRQQEIDIAIEEVLKILRLRLIDQFASA